MPTRVHRPISKTVSLLNSVVGIDRECGHSNSELAENPIECVGSVNQQQFCGIGCSPASCQGHSRAIRCPSHGQCFRVVGYCATVCGREPITHHSNQFRRVEALVGNVSGLIRIDYMRRRRRNTELYERGLREGDRLCPPEKSEDDYHNSDERQQYRAESLRVKYSHRSVVPVSVTDDALAWTRWHSGHVASNHVIARLHRPRRADRPESEQFADQLKSAAPAHYSVWSIDDSAWRGLTDRCGRFELAVRGAVVDDQCRASAADRHGAIPHQAASACVHSSRRRCRCFDTGCIDTGTRTLVRSAPTWIASLCSPRGISHCGSHTDRYHCTQRAPSCAATN